MKKVKQFKHTEYLNTQVRPPPPAPPLDEDENIGGNDSVFTPNIPWSTLGLHPQIVEHVEKLYPHPTHIQSIAIPVMLKGKDVIGVSETGSGKSAAFILPILHNMLVQKDEVSPCTALILTPTRELALQVEAHCNSLGKVLDLKTAHLIGGEESKDQKYVLEKRKPHIVIGTPGRVRGMLDFYKGFNLFRCRFLVIDESDTLLGVKYKKDVDEILRYYNTKKHSNMNKATFVFTATMTKKVWKLQKLQLRPGAEKISTKSTSQRNYGTVQTLDQKYLFIPENLKEVYLCYVLNELAGKRVLVFVGQNKDCLVTTVLLRSVGFPAVPMTSLMSESHRLSCLRKFTAGDFPTIVATDLAARGLDIPDIDVVINFDIPSQSKDYIHRVGRTARAGKQGMSITFVTQYDLEYFQKLEGLIGKKMSEFETRKEDAMVLCSTVLKALKMSKSRVQAGELGIGMGEKQDEKVIDDAITNLKKKRKKRKKRRTGGGKKRKRNNSNNNHNDDFSFQMSNKQRGGKKKRRKF